MANGEESSFDNKLLLKSNNRSTSTNGSGGNVINGRILSRIVSQIKLLVWKRYVETTKNYFEFVRILGPPFIFFVLIHLAYATFDFFSPGGVEPLLVPFAFFIFAQRIVLQIMYEKCNRLQEAMKMMGLLDASYWLSYFVAEAVITGVAIAFMCAVISGGTLFNHANFGDVFGFLIVYCLAIVPFCFFITCFFDTPQTAGQATLGILLGKKFYFPLYNKPSL
jgi:hypothetical protein